MKSPRYLALRLLGVLPQDVRRKIVQTIAPSYMLGAICWIEHPDDGKVLLVKNTYRDKWVFPGGLVDKGERPYDAAVREVLEETNLRVELTSPPVVTLDPTLRRVEFTYRAKFVDGCTPDELKIDYIEIVDSGWFAPEELPKIDHEYDGLATAVGRSDDAMQLLYATWSDGERFLTPGVK